MTMVVNAGNVCRHAEILRRMHVDRKRIFVDWLRWDVPHDGAEERDQFDDEDAEYIIVCAEDGSHLGSVRLLRTDGPHILGDVFPNLCEGPVPRSPLLREVTRLCVSPDCPSDQRQGVRREIVCALAEYGLMEGLLGYTLLTEMSFLSRIAALGWRCEMLGLPMAHGDQMLGALRLHLDAQTIPSLRRSGVYRDTVLGMHAQRIAA